MVGLYVQLPKSISAILNNLSFAWHFDQASKGIFNTKDIFWLAGFSVLFILLTIKINDELCLLDQCAGKRRNASYIETQ